MLEWMRKLVAGEENFWVLEKLVPDHVAECVVFLVDCEDSGVWDFGIEFFEDSKKECLLELSCKTPRQFDSLFLALVQQKRFEGGWRVHPVAVAAVILLNT